jgi:hypothetical protein
MSTLGGHGVENSRLAMGRANDLFSLAPMAKSTLSQSAGATAPHPRLRRMSKRIESAAALQYPVLYLESSDLGLGAAAIVRGGGAIPNARLRL